jgi:hypothetical protein
VETGGDRSRLRFWHVLLLLPLVAIVAWVAGRARTQRDDPADVLRDLKAQQAPSLPEATASGADQRSPLEQYDRQSLYDYIDGAAEAFIQRGFERCAVATYTARVDGHGPIEITAETYRFSSPAGARQQFDADRPAVAKDATQLPGAVSDGTVLLLAHGRDLLKLTSLGRGVDASLPLLAIASAWIKEQPR